MQELGPLVLPGTGGVFLDAPTPVCLACINMLFCWLRKHLQFALSSLTVSFIILSAWLPKNKNANWNVIFRFLHGFVHTTTFHSLHKPSNCNLLSKPHQNMPPTWKVVFSRDAGRNYVRGTQIVPCYRTVTEKLSARAFQWSWNALFNGLSHSEVRKRVTAFLLSASQTPNSSYWGTKDSCIVSFL